MRHLLSVFVLVTLSLPALSGDQFLVIEPVAPRLELEEQGAYELGIGLRGAPLKWMPPGWSGLDEATNTSLEPRRRHGGRSATFVHPPYRTGPGGVVQQYTIQLPEQPAGTLRGATATAAEASQGDGVTFRVWAGDTLLWEQHHMRASWQEFEVDLAPWAGKTVVLRFETDCGPADNTSFDWSYWSGRVIELPGFERSLPAHPAPPALDLARLSAQPNGDAAPLTAHAGTHDIAIDAATGQVQLTHRGADGDLQYCWTPPRNPDDPPLGRWILHATGTGGQTLGLPLATGNTIAWTHPATLSDSETTLADESAHCRATWRVGDLEAHLDVTARLIGKSLVLDLACDQPVIAQVQAGRWGVVAYQRRLNVPYYPGPVELLPQQNLFVAALVDPAASHASNLIETGAVYKALTDGSLNLLRERVIFTAAWHLAEVLPNLPHPASPFREMLGGRVVFDIWGGRYADIADTLAMLGDYGITDHAVIIHDWQHHGYDNGLPTHYPANPQRGSEEEMQRLIATGRELGHLMALHENYVDYYPNYEHFQEAHIALDSAGKRQLAWYHPGTKIQSFAVAPHVMVDLARTQSPEIQRRYGTNASFLDVCSCVPPSFHTDQRAGTPLAGNLQQTRSAHLAIWQFLRTTYRGPVLGEGNGHWLWSGWLDGVEAQFGTGWAHNAGMTAPLFVDFDLLRVHPLQLNHGMGYFSRWYDDAPWGNALPMVVLDQYRMQEIAYGHAGFLNSNWNRLQDAWLETHLMSPVTARHATATVAQIEYHTGAQWVDTTAAVKAGQLDRVRVTWDNGLVIVANSGAGPWEVDGVTLPRFGWVARSSDLLAYTALRDGVVVDFVRTPDSLFANARPGTDWQIDQQALFARPAVESFQQTGPRRFQVTYAWDVQQDAGQQQPAECVVTWHEPMTWANRPWHQHWLERHAPAAPDAWRGGQQIVDGPHELTLPETLADGEYLWELTLREAGGRQLPLDGYCDGQQQVRLGYLVVHDGGTALSFRAPADVPPRSAWQTQHINLQEQEIDFGPVRTAGSVSLRRAGDQWHLRTVPRDRPFPLWFDAREIAPPEAITAEFADGRSAAVQPLLRDGHWGLELNGARLYRWSAPADQPADQPAD